VKTTPENKVKLQVKALLTKYKAFSYPAVAGFYSTAGIPDIVGCYKGKFFGVECKAYGKKPTPLQIICRDKIEAAGGAWFMVDGEDSLSSLERWIDE
jgi:penicillin-binding protein-related factor A (putative recombinase)